MALINIHIHTVDVKEIKEILFNIKSKLNYIMAKQSELAAQIADFTAQLGKAKDEILAKVAALEAQIGTGSDEVTPELQAAVDNLKSAVQTLDDIVPDAPAPTV